MNLKNIVEKSCSFSEVSRKLGYSYINGKIRKKIRDSVIEENIDYSHFRKNGDSQKRYERIQKKCPVCGKYFEALEGHKKEKKTCSYACSNTHFRSGMDNGNWSEKAYRSTCFLHHEKRCVCCDEKLIVEVHHLDHNKKNNEPENLIPLCPTHHQYWHSNYRHMVEKEVMDYLKKWIYGLKVISYL
jgi:hypothetical protein